VEKNLGHIFCGNLYASEDQSILFNQYVDKFYYKMISKLVLFSFISGVLSGTVNLTPKDDLQKAFDNVKPGDTISLGDGLYTQDVITKVDGEPSKRITVSGSRKAILNGSGNNNRIFEINHDYYTLDGFTIDGKHGSGEKEEDYLDKCLFVIGKKKPRTIRDEKGEYKSSLDGLVVKNMLLTNSGGETMRVRSFATNVEVYGNHFHRAGIHAVIGGLKSKNAEQIYIGTSSNQWYDGKNSVQGPDLTRYVWIHHNEFTGGCSEAVETSKEGAEYVLVEYNMITDQIDPEAGGIGIRSDNVVVRYNDISNTKGAGVRIGGHTIKGRTYGKNNHVYGNTFSNTGYGSFKIQTGPQGYICENKCKGGCTSKGNLGKDYSPESSCKSVPDVEWLKNSDGSLPTESVEEPKEEDVKEPAISIGNSEKLSTGDKCFPITVKNAKASNEDGENYAMNAVDGKAVTRWSANGDDQWLEIDFGYKKDVNAIEMAFFKGDTRIQMFDVYVEGSLVLKDQKSSGKSLGLERFSFEEVSGEKLSIFGHGNTENTWNSITQIVACSKNLDKNEHDSNMEEDETCDKISKLDVKSVDASSNDGNVPENVLDGDMKSRWSASGEQSIVLSFDRPVFVYEVGIAFFKGNERKALFDILVKTQDGLWEEILVDGNSAKGNGIESYDIMAGNVVAVKIVGYGSVNFSSGKSDP